MKAIFSAIATDLVLLVLVVACLSNQAKVLERLDTIETSILVLKGGYDDLRAQQIEIAKLKLKERELLETIVLRYAKGNCKN